MNRQQENVDKHTCATNQSKYCNLEIKPMSVEIKALLKEGAGNCDVTMQNMPTSHKVQPYLHTSTHAVILSCYALAYANRATVRSKLTV